MSRVHRPGGDREVLEGISEIAREQLAWTGEISRELDLLEAFRLDSMRMLTLVVAVEDRFRICLDDGVHLQIETVGDLVDAIRSELERPAGDTE